MNQTRIQVLTGGPRPGSNLLTLQCGGVAGGSNIIFEGGPSQGKNKPIALGKRNAQNHEQ